MGSLGLHADPERWLNAGYSIRTLMDSLDSELYDADRIGGTGLSAHWAGPVAEAFNGNWSGLRSRAEDLIAQGRRAAAAITDFGGRLEDFVKRAADLESYWLGFGLQIGLDGMHFALPWGFEQLSPVHQISFHQWLSESERDVTAMWSDVRAAVDDVVTALESLIAAFEDFAVLELGTAAGLIGGYLGGYFKDPASFAEDGFEVLADGLKRGSTHALDNAYKVVVTAGEDASRDAQTVADATTRSAVRYAKVAKVFDDVDKIGGPVLMGVGVGLTAWQTYTDSKKYGWVNGIEDHVGDWAGIAAGIGVGAAIAAAPVAVPVVGVVVLSGIAAYGVGAVVQWQVDDHRQQVGHGLTDIDHGVEDAAGWEGRHVDGLVKFA
jgi:hypothetical protein